MSLTKKSSCIKAWSEVCVRPAEAGANRPSHDGAGECIDRPVIEDNVLIGDWRQAGGG